MMPAEIALILTFLHAILEEKQLLKIKLKK